MIEQEGRKRILGKGIVCRGARLGITLGIALSLRSCEQRQYHPVTVADLTRTPCQYYEGEEVQVKGYLSQEYSSNVRFINKDIPNPLTNGKEIIGYSSRQRGQNLYDSAIPMNPSVPLYLGFDIDLSHNSVKPTPTSSPGSVNSNIGNVTVNTGANFPFLTDQAIVEGDISHNGSVCVIDVHRIKR